jgi:threonine synthase
VLPRTRHAVSLGEGHTPLLHIPYVPAPAGASVHAKLELLNPTLSFKDRGMALAASVALDLGAEGLVLASSGNAAVSAAAYAAAAGLKCTVFCGRQSQAETKLLAAEAYGAEVHRIEGDYSAAYAEASRAERGGWLNVTTTYRNPLLAEAYRTIAYELAEQLGAAPDVVVIPVGAGPLLYGIHGGFRDLVTAGITSRTPKLVGVQAQACAPLARAWEDGDWQRVLETPVPTKPTAAAAIADSLRGYEREGLLTLNAVHESGGAVLAVTEEAIGTASASLAAHGLLVEPAAATAVAVLSQPHFAALAGRDAVIAVILTGHGAKELRRSTA